MNRPLTTYMFLERVMMEADEAGDDFAELVRDHMMPFWDALSDDERQMLLEREGKSIDEKNPTRIGGTNIPGTSAKHAIVTDVCRANRGDVGAIDEALDRLRSEALACAPAWNGRGSRFHFVLTVEPKGR